MDTRGSLSAFWMKGWVSERWWMNEQTFHSEAPWLAGLCSLFLPLSPFPLLVLSCIFQRLQARPSAGLFDNQFMVAGEEAWFPVLSTWHMQWNISFRVTEFQPKERFARRSLALAGVCCSFLRWLAGPLHSVCISVCLPGVFIVRLVSGPKASSSTGYWRSWMLAIGQNYIMV